MSDRASADSVGLEDKPACIAVAYSGGRDSTALLHATARAAGEVQGLRVLALHVHHGISQQADQWLVHAEQQCAQWAQQGMPVQLMSTRLNLPLQAGDSVEAVARKARYQALARMAQEAGANCVLLAHHQQDQAETFLLQALRGAGVAGLAAMPAQVQRHGVMWLRPWLHHDRSAIEAYIHAHGLHHIEDDTNADARYARNRLRLKVWPSLADQFPQAASSLAQAAEHSADAQWCLQQWAKQQLALLSPDQSTVEPENRSALVRLNANAWSLRPGPERRELLRHWYQQVAGTSLSRAWIERLDREAPVSLASERAVHWPGTGLGLYRGEWIWQPESVLRHDPIHTILHARPDPVLNIHAEGEYDLPAFGGILKVAAAEGGQSGVPWSTLSHLRVTHRTGGENFQMAANRPARSLKKQFQAAGVPAWLRHAPLFYDAQDRLVFVPGLGVDARVMGAEAQSCASLSWVFMPQGFVAG